MDTLYGGIEAGGTKFVCAVGTGPDDIRAGVQFITTTPDETLGKAESFFADFIKAEKLDGIGIASFGPVDLDPGSEKHGWITRTPKPGWTDTDFAGRLKRNLGVPVAFDTDVNGAALGEYLWGAAQGFDTFIYLTVGTGIGGGGMVGGKLMHGLLHPEMGHMRLPHDMETDPFEGCCPYHGDCLEGLASGKAMEMRWGLRPADLPAGHPGWGIEADYLALGLNNLICTLSPQRIIIGGGLMKHPKLLDMVRDRTASLLNGYLVSTAITKHLDDYIVPPALGDRAGVLGALGLASVSFSGQARG